MILIESRRGLQFDRETTDFMAGSGESEAVAGEATFHRMTLNDTLAPIGLLIESIEHLSAPLIH